MKCPLTLVFIYDQPDGTQDAGKDCLKEECAWWNKGWTMCWIASIGDDLMRLANLIEVIRDKMPNEEQFRL